MEDTMHFRKLMTVTLSICLMTVAFLAPARRTYAKEISGASNPAWSPDGKQIAYSIFHDQIPDLYIIDVNGSKPVKVAENAGQPAWSPDGKRIAYSSSEDITNYVNIVDVETRKPTRIAVGYTPKWSPDGKTLAYLA